MDNFYAYEYCTKHILRMYFSCSELTAMPVSGSVSSVHRFESICKFLHFIDNSYQDTHERTTKTVQNVSYYQTLKFKIQQDRWITHNVEGQPILQPVPATETVTVQGGFKLYKSSSGYLWSSTVYTEKRQVYSHPTLKKNTKNISTSSESFWTHTP